MNENFYENKLKEIEKLFNEGRLNDSLVLIQEELSMPYIPLMYEETFIKWKSKIMEIINGEKVTSKNITIEQILDYLKSNDPIKEIVAIENISRHNLRPYAKELSNIITSWDKSKNNVRALLFETLAEQKIDINILIDAKIFNPSHDSIFDEEYINKIRQDIERLSIQEPQLTKLAMLELQHYILMIFPSKTIVSDLGIKIINISKSMLGHDVKLSKEEEEIKKILIQDNV